MSIPVRLFRIKCTMAVQMLENKSCFVWRGCGFATVRSQRQNPSTAHNLHPEFDHFHKKRLPKKACVRRGHWPGARHIAACARHGIYVALCTRWHPRRILPHEQHTIAGCLCARAAVRAFVAGIIPCSWQRRVWASSRPSPSAFSVQVVDDSVVLQPSRRTLRRSLG